jgi:hypothetical protein
MKRVNIVLSEWAEVMETMFGRTRSSHGIFQSVPYEHPLHIDAKVNRAIARRAVS